MPQGCSPEFTPVQFKCWQFAVFAFRVQLPTCSYRGVLSIARYADQVQEVSNIS